MFLQEPTANTTGYMIAGYVVAFVVMAIYVASMYLRSRNLKQDMSMLDEMDKSASTPAPKRGVEKPASQKTSKV